MTSPLSDRSSLRAPPSVAPNVNARSRLHLQATTSGMLLALAATPLMLFEPTVHAVRNASSWLQWSALGISALILLASVSITRAPILGRIFATLAMIGSFALGASKLLESPVAALTVLVGGTLAFALLWKLGAPLIGRDRARLRPVHEGQAQGAAFVGLALWCLWTFAELEHSWPRLLVVTWALVVSAVLGVEWALRARRTNRIRAFIVLGVAAAGGLAAIGSFVAAAWWWGTSALVAESLLVAIVARRPAGAELDEVSWWEPLLGHPERLFVGTFAVLCTAGTILLALPQSSTSGTTIGFIDAAFTATSAVCVTGLATLDTPNAFTGLGQFFLLLLIQVGGLGIMTFSTAAIWALGRRMSMRHEGAVASLLSTHDRGQLYQTARRILRLTVISESVGAAILTASFIAHGDSFGKALWNGVFTAVSAFCNAGFALHSDNLMSYESSPIVIHVVAMLIIIGGISPAAMFVLPAILRRSTMPIPAQVRLIFATTLALLVGGFLFYLAFEWNASLAHLSVVDRLHNAWFQSVTLRTAGFNTVDLTLARPATVTLMIVWMFIGGSPGGTAGGIKTTTLSVLVISIVHAMRGDWNVEAFGKSIPPRTRAKASVVLMISLFVVLCALVAMQLTQQMPTYVALFEVVSALGTVGLTIGGTPALDGIGKAIIICCMFAGRVGGLTMLSLWTVRRSSGHVVRPLEEIDVG